jgi:Ca2+-transporting ATPase
MRDADFPEGGRKVCVVGESTVDLENMAAADVAFAMGEGKSIARNNASMVLLSNDFECIIKAVMWGRNIYANVKRFLQFQITCNLACLVTIFVGTLFLTESPLSATQLIWINLIMDTLGAMALATAPPLASIIHEPPQTVNSSILTKTVWRQIYGVALWMCAVMFVVVWLGRTLFDLDYEKDTQTTDGCPIDANGDRPDTCPELTMAANKRTHMTIIFTTFVFLQWWNEFNCRVVGAAEYNIFKKLHNGWTFILVLAVIFGVQYIACDWFTFIFETVALDGQQFGQCVVTGATVLIAAFALKLTPQEWVEKLPIKIDENEVMGGESALMGAYESQAKGQIPDFSNYGKGETDPLNEGEDDGYTRA